MIALPRTGAHPGLGIVLIVVGVSLFGMLDNATRYLGASLPVLLLLWVRYAFQAAAMAVWLLVSRRSPGGAGFSVAHPRFQAMRGALLLATSAISFYGLQHMPAAEFTAINMLTPVIVTLMAGWLLHEHVSRLRWTFVVGGFAGALIVMRPGGGYFGWVALFPLSAAVTYASFQVLTSRLAGLESPYTTHFYTGLVGVVLMTPVLLLSPVDLASGLAAVTPLQLVLLFCLGLFATAGHLLLILAFGLAPASTLMPFVYAQIGAAALVGWVVFGYLPDAWSWVGMAVVAVCGAASAWLNVREAARPPSVVALDATAD